MAVPSRTFLSVPLVSVVLLLTSSSPWSTSPSFSSTIVNAFAPSSSMGVGPTNRAILPSTIRAHNPKGRISIRNSNSNSDNESSSQVKEPHIVILGGGFGGINTALTLPTLPWPTSDTSSKYTASTTIRPRITLIDRSERFVFLPLLYELCVEDASLEEVAPTYKSLLEGVVSSGSSSSSGDDSSNTSGWNGGGVSFVKAQVEGIDVTNQQVIISHSPPSVGDHDNTAIIETINYDALVIATGAEISLNSIPGASRYALPFYTIEECLELKRRLKLLDSYLEGQKRIKNKKSIPKEGGIDKEKKGPLVNVVVVGGGYSGVELALNLMDRLGGGGDGDNQVEVTLVHRGKQVLEYATDYNRKAGLERLQLAGVTVMTETSVVEVMPWDDKEDDTTESVSTSSLEKQQCIVKLSTSSSQNKNDTSTTSLVPTNLLLWTAGATPSIQNTGIRNSLLPRDVMGKILTSPTLNVPEYPNVFAIGDCSRPKKVPYPGTAQVAMQMATVAAWNAYATLIQADSSNGKQSTQHPKLLPFNYLNLGEMMTLGTNDATISSLGGLVQWSGPAASWLRRWIYAVRMPTAKQGLVAVVDGTERKLVRGLVDATLGSGGRSRNKEGDGSGERKSKPVDWR